jgi:predicted RecB family nuclease
LTDPIKGTSGFTEEFAKRGPHDVQRRSLRDFDLKRRLFAYPCSYVIYSEAFEALPAAVKDYILRRLWEVLSGKDTSKEFAHLSAADRQAVLEILRATKPNLPDYFFPSRARSAAE